MKRVNPREKEGIRVLCYGLLVESLSSVSLIEPIKVLTCSNSAAGTLRGSMKETIRAANGFNPLILPSKVTGDIHPASDARTLEQSIHIPTKQSLLGHVRNGTDGEL